MSDRLTEIVRDAYMTGANASAFFIMSAETRKAVAGIAAPPEQDPWAVPRDVWARLTAIPVVLDNATPPNVWRLLDRAGNEIERGEIEPDTTGGQQP